MKTATNVAGGVRSKAKIPVAPFAYRMEWVDGQEMNDPAHLPGYCCWSTWPVQGDDGRFHLFGDRWPGDPMGFLNGSELTYYVADKPEGPYRFVGIPLEPGKPGEWDEVCFYPGVRQDAGRWVMMYTGMRRHETECSSMCGGIAVADSIGGPWHKTGKVLEPSNDPAHWTFQATLGIHVPCFIRFRGRWHAYFKSGSFMWPDYKSGTRVNRDFMGVALADRPEGPYRIEDRPCILRNGAQVGGYIEDMYPFVWKGRLYLLVTDNLGFVSGVQGGILLFESDDGLVFPFDKVRLAADVIPAYFKGWDPKRATFQGSYNAKFEAPRLLWIDGRPAYFVGSSGTNVGGGDARCSHYWLKIVQWDLE
jgi:hypothetical protein